MITRLLFILILLIPNIAFGRSLWGKIEDCVSNPCTCHCSPDPIIEYWPSVTTQDKTGAITSTRTEHKYKNYCNCPPYKRTKGRSGCLKQFNVPSGGLVSNLCAESPGPSLSSYFNPHIRIRGQFCNVAACWTKAITLRYSGECLNWPGPYGLPLKRVCARLALSGDSKSNGLDDDGYTPKVHLDFEGYEQPDEILYDDNGDRVEYNPPKLCAYIDPSIFQPEGKLDLLDMNPKNQPFHTGSGLSPIAQMMISIADAGMSITSVLPIILTKMDVPQTFVNSIKALARFGDNTIVSILKQMGQLNKTVSSRLGCVDVALGPFPPPFCNPLTITVGRPSIERICPTVTSDTGLCSGSATQCVVASREDSPCVNSSVVNNAIQNTLRIGFNKITPICSGTGSYTTDQCVSLSLLSAATAHNSYADIIPSSLIVNRPALTPGAGQTGFRAVYGTMLAGSIEISGAYDPNLPDCLSSNSFSSTQCQIIYGINAGNFVDLSLTFPSLENSYNITTLVVPVPIIVDPAGLARKFSAAITRIEDPSDSGAIALGIIDSSGSSSPTQTTNQICVFDMDKSPPESVGCVERALAPKPYVFSCNGSNVINTGGVYITCPSNDNNNPAVVVSLTVGASTTAGALYIPSNNITTNSPTQLNLAGNDYTAFVTDTNYNIAPFFTRGPSTSLTANYLYGTYLDSSYLPTTTPPYTVNLSGKVNTNNVKYLYGLEYQDGLYSGAVSNESISPQYKLFTCIEPASVTPCPENVKNCVLANLSRNDIVDCATFATLSEESYSPLRKCSSTDRLCWSSADKPCTATTGCPVLRQSSLCDAKDCTYLASIPALSTAPSGIGVNIYSCPADSSTGDTASYCYYHPTTNNICQITSDRANRIFPDPTVGDILSESDYYDYSSPIVTSAPIVTNPDIIDCSSYLSNLATDPYTANIMPCDSSYNSCSVKEYFSSQNPAQILTIKNCTNSGSPVQCYIQRNSGICQLSKLLTVRYSSDPSAPNPTISTNATSSSVVANKLLVPDSYVSCQEFLKGMNDLYSNIQLCNNAQTVSACPVINIVSSTNPVASVNVQKCTISQTTNCYINPTGLPFDMNSLIASYPAYSNMCNSNMNNMSCNTISDLTSTLGVILQQCTEVTTNYCYSTINTSCNLGCSGAQEGLQSKPCDDFISLMTIPSSANLYGDIPQCGNDVSCPSNTDLTLTYGSGAICAANNPTCNDVEMVSNGGANLFTIKSCTSSGYNVTYNGTTTAVNGPNNYYCYISANSSCNVMLNQSVVRRDTSSGSTLTNPSTTNIPNICNIELSSNSVTPPNTTPCSTTNLNPSLCSIRTKTAIERGLCSDLMHYPKCSAISANNISWSEIDVGQQASGRCTGGTVSSDLTGRPPTRYCLADTNKDTATSMWGGVTGACIPGCGATTISGSVFTTTNPGIRATGTCASGYIKANSGNFPQALCVNRSDILSTFDTIQDPCQISNCARATINGAIIPQTEPGNISADGSCDIGFTQNAAGPPKAYCRANTGTSSTFDAVQNPCVLARCGGGVYHNAEFTTVDPGRTAYGSCISGYMNSLGGPPQISCSANGVASFYRDCVRVTCNGNDGSTGYQNSNQDIYNGRADWNDANAYDQRDNIWVVGSCPGNGRPHARCRNPDIYPRRQCILSADGKSASWGAAAVICKDGDFDSGSYCSTEQSWRQNNNVFYAPNSTGWE